MRPIKLLIAFLLVFALISTVQAQKKFTERQNSGGFEYTLSLTSIDSAFTSMFTTSWVDLAFLAGKTVYVTYEMTGDAAYRADTLLGIVQGWYPNLPNMVDNVDTLIFLKDTIRSGEVKTATQLTFSPNIVFPEYRMIITARTPGATDNISRLDIGITAPAMNLWNDRQKFNK